MPETRDIPSVLVIVPTYNESESICSLIGEILKLDPRFEVLVIDDASPDGTADLVAQKYQERVHLIRRSAKLGYASACREGFQWGIQKNVSAVVVMDADNSHNPCDIPSLIAQLEQCADIAIGSRYLNGVRVLNWPLPRLLLSVGGGLYARVLTGLPISDLTSGFKAIHRNVLEKIAWNRLASEGYSFNIETYFFARKKGFRIVEVPIVFTERRRGASKMTRKIMIEAVFRVLRLAILRFLP